MTTLAFNAGSTTTFTAVHIAVTALLTGVLALGAALWRLPRTASLDIAAISVLSAASVYLWRSSANMPQLNDDGLPGFSADDWLAPVLTYVLLSTYAALRQPSDRTRFDQARALATLASLAVNVVTI